MSEKFSGTSRSNKETAFQEEQLDAEFLYGDEEEASLAARQTKKEAARVATSGKEKLILTADMRVDDSFESEFESQEDNIDLHDLKQHEALLEDAQTTIKKVAEYCDKHYPPAQSGESLSDYARQARQRLSLIRAAGGSLKKEMNSLAEVMANNADDSSIINRKIAAIENVRQTLQKHLDAFYAVAEASINEESIPEAAKMNFATTEVDRGFDSKSPTQKSRDKTDFPTTVSEKDDSIKLTVPYKDNEVGNLTELDMAILSPMPKAELVSLSEEFQSRTIDDFFTNLSERPITKEEEATVLAWKENLARIAAQYQAEEMTEAKREDVKEKYEKVQVSLEQFIANIENPLPDEFLFRIQAMRQKVHAFSHIPFEDKRNFDTQYQTFVRLLQNDPNLNPMFEGMDRSERITQAFQNLKHFYEAAVVGRAPEKRINWEPTPGKKVTKEGAFVPEELEQLKAEYNEKKGAYIRNIKLLLDNNTNNKSQQQIPFSTLQNWVATSAAAYYPLREKVGTIENREWLRGVVKDDEVIKKLEKKVLNYTSPEILMKGSDRIALYRQQVQELYSSLPASRGEKVRKFLKQVKNFGLIPALALLASTEPLNKNEQTKDTSGAQNGTSEVSEPAASPATNEPATYMFDETLTSPVVANETAPAFTNNPEASPQAPDFGLLPTVEPKDTLPKTNPTESSPDQSASPNNFDTAGISELTREGADLRTSTATDIAVTQTVPEAPEFTSRSSDKLPSVDVESFEVPLVLSVVPGGTSESNISTRMLEAYDKGEFANYSELMSLSRREFSALFYKAYAELQKNPNFLTSSVGLASGNLDKIGKDGVFTFDAKPILEQMQSMQIPETSKVESVTEEGEASPIAEKTKAESQFMLTETIIDKLRDEHERGSKGYDKAYGIWVSGLQGGVETKSSSWLSNIFGSEGYSPYQVLEELAENGTAMTVEDVGNIFASNNQEELTKAMTNFGLKNNKVTREFLESILTFAQVTELRIQPSDSVVDVLKKAFAQSEWERQRKTP